MAPPARVPPEQRRTLARLIATPLPVDLYLAGGAAVGYHVGHRTSLDLDLFTAEPNADLSQARRAILNALPDAEVRDLAVMKLAAIAKRGLRRDFWDLHAILCARGVPLD